ncbi:3-hydroxyacyl-[acyl-carrier-protein] dehydratase [Weissella uvarum]|uniref:3-hydroxyacyl-ACP dehydratase FabZ n=1 Tax=Weissella uvarum TaxID=1479233 RepID=UPI00196059BD|nr:3-hydroxyacyl-ACP dehydratase FabZ [Weissella uvarum]MBM7617724.1 3-hydroxyacyl-[acyl-carrier-protein] dehydratase [Weissella uvarum]MCM0595897.1 3-hydroxyacyl-ACP dehydratase FabZ [Weissella uvarum]
MELDTAQIQEILPHRYPMLLVDRVIDLEPGKSITGIKNVSRNEEVFQGHFPGNPIFPGVMQIEALAQTGAIAILSMPEFEGKTAYLASVPKARFHKPVQPGDQMELKVELERFRGPMGVGKGTAYVNGKRMTTAELTFAIGD